jgi:hypothetical protein
MATRALARGKGTFFKDCEHPESRWSKCPHPYKIRYRNAAGNQAEESGFATQDAAKVRLMKIYNEKTSQPQSQARAERIAKYGPMRFEEYAREWKEGQRHLAASSIRHLDSLFEHHIFPVLGSRKMASFDHKVVDVFIRAMERAHTGLATQSNAFDKIRAILLDAQRLGRSRFSTESSDWISRARWVTSTGPRHDVGCAGLMTTVVTTAPAHSLRRGRPSGSSHVRVLDPSSIVRLRGGLAGRERGPSGGPAQPRSSSSASMRRIPW